jgi:hypothetical protein
MTSLKPSDIPPDFPVRPLAKLHFTDNEVTCGQCGLTWDDSILTGWTPAPSGRCPFEYFHAPSHPLPMTNPRPRPRVNWTATPEVQNLIKILAELHRRSESHEAQVAMELYIKRNRKELDFAFDNGLSDLYEKLSPEEQEKTQNALLVAASIQVP